MHHEAPEAPDANYFFPDELLHLPSTMIWLPTESALTVVGRVVL